MGGANWVELGSVGAFVRGKGIQKIDLRAAGRPAIHYGQIHAHYGVKANCSISFVEEETYRRSSLAQHGSLVIATTSEDDQDVGKAVVWLGNHKAAVSGDAVIFQHELEPRFVAHFFRSSSFHLQKRRWITGAKVRRISPASLAKIRIPKPSLQEQTRVADVLDKFDALVNDLSSGLPAEIEARRKQYEYYRDKLLSFKELESEAA